MGYSCEYFPSRTTCKRLLLRKDNVATNFLTRNFMRYKLVKKTNMPNVIKSLKYIKHCSSNSPDLLQALAVLWDTSGRRSADDLKHLKPY